MPGDNKVANPQPVATSGSSPATENQPKEKSFFQKYAGSLIQILVFWMIMRVISTGKDR